MTHVSIVGTGNMGEAISSVVTKGGNTVEMFDTSDRNKPVTGDIVVLAVPHPAISSVIAERRDQLTGKIVIDITNPLNVETFDSLAVPADSSATAEIAASLPQSRVVKAFNTTFAGTVAAGTIDGRPTTVLIAGDDADAKSVVADVATAGGLRAVDAGPLRRARELEALGFLQIALASNKAVSTTGGFAVVS